MPARKYSWQCILICVAVLFPCGFFQSKLLGQHFNSSDSLNFNLPAQNTGVSIIAVGDVMLGSWIIPILNEKGSSYPFAHTSPYLQSADIAFANLEAPFTQDGEAFEKKYNFKVPPEYAQGIRTAGMDVVSLANNHIMDYGQTGLVSTIKILDEIGMQHCGAGLNLNQAHQPAVLKVNDKTIAFFAYSMTFPVEFYAKSDSSGTAYPEPELMQCALLTWEELVDFTVVSFHWSAEKLEIPKD
ncbi:MAG: CapA family protein, partial [bacterium]